MSEERKTIPPRVPWYYARVTVFALIFLVAGAFALPVLWLSPAFSVRGKVLWSIVATVYTVIAVLLLLCMNRVVWEMWSQILS